MTTNPTTATKDPREILNSAPMEMRKAIGKRFCHWGVPELRLMLDVLFCGETYTSHFDFYGVKIWSGIRIGIFLSGRKKR